jgi:hypothetical protein
MTATDDHYRSNVYVTSVHMILRINVRLEELNKYVLFINPCIQPYRRPSIFPSEPNKSLFSSHFEDCRKTQVCAKFYGAKSSTIVLRHCIYFLAKIILQKMLCEKVFVHMFRPT